MQSNFSSGRFFRSAAALIGASLILLSLDGCARKNDDVQSGDPEKSSLPVEYALLTQAPGVPPPIHRSHPAHVIVDLEVREVVKRLADGVDYTFWTFGGSVPGLFIRVREGDLVELRLKNHPTSKMPHNIDLHAVAGPGGGAAATLTAPGHSSTFFFTALNPGLFVYHCATAPVPMHVGNGMYGLILVEPKRGLPPVDHEYYVMQGEFYTAGKYGESGLQPFDPEKADNERPPYVVFNGGVGALTEDRAIKASVGDTVRVFFGDGGPNLTSSFHIIGEIFDTVYQEAGEAPTHNVQTTVVPPGGATIVEFKTRTPGNFAIVDHSLSRAFGKGAMGTLLVGGNLNKMVYSGKVADGLYAGSAAEVLKESVASGVAVVGETSPTSEGPAGSSLDARIERGRRVFLMSCFACHQADGKGIASVFPPLAGSDFLRNNRKQVIDVPIKGLTGPVVVNGKPYNNVMPAQLFSDQQIADVLTYVMNSWGNNGGTVSLEEVKRARIGTIPNALGLSTVSAKTNGQVSAAAE